MSTPDITFGEFEAVEAVNPYIEHIKALDEKNDPKASITVTVDAADEARTIQQIQRAGNAVGKTARVRLRNYDNAKAVSTDDKGKPVYEGKVGLTFTLTSLHKPRRKGTGKTAEANPAKAEKNK